MHYFTLCALLLFSGCAGFDPSNSAQYQAEIHPAVAGMSAVTAHVRADLARGKTRTQIEADIGFAAVNEAILFMAQMPQSPAK